MRPVPYLLLLQLRRGGRDGLKLLVNVGSRRSISSLSGIRALFHLVKARYILLGSTALGGYYLHQKYPETQPDAQSSPPSTNFMTAAQANVQQWWSQAFPHSSSSKFLPSSSSTATNKTSNAITTSSNMILDALDEMEAGGLVIGSNIWGRDSGSTKSAYQSARPLNKQQAEEYEKKVAEIKEQHRLEMEKLQRELRDLRQQIVQLRKSHGLPHLVSRMHKSPIDMYSEVLDQMELVDEALNVPDHLPRVVVVGEANVGKTSVLEMLAGARIFPRLPPQQLSKVLAGGSRLRSPLKVTLSEGPYHVARFRNSPREYDLTKDEEVAELRREIESRILNSMKATDDETSSSSISLTVQGPQLQRMVLVDLPGIIPPSSETNGKPNEPADRRDAAADLQKLVRQHMQNPNALLLAVLDSSAALERNATTQLVSSVDPQGKRTLIVLTKVDQTPSKEAVSQSRERLRRVLEGKSSLRALGFFAVVAGRGDPSERISSVCEYESKFFRDSSLYPIGDSRREQLSTSKLSHAVSHRFWRMVRECADQQADFLRAVRYNLETEWRHTFPQLRELTREELFERTRGELLDELVRLSNVGPGVWNKALLTGLWDKVGDTILEDVCVPAAEAQSLSAWQTQVDIRLGEWLRHDLPLASVSAAWDSIFQQWRNIQEKVRLRDGSPVEGEEVCDPLRQAVFDACFLKHRWDNKAEASLKVIQSAALEERNIHTKAQWDLAVGFFETSVEAKLLQVQDQLRGLCGPGGWFHWLRWESPSDLQRTRRAIVEQLQDTLLREPSIHESQLTQDEVSAVRRALMTKNVFVDDDMILDMWVPVHRLHFYQLMNERARECRKGYFHYQQGFTKELSMELDCREVPLFWRVHRLLEASSNALRQQVMNNEIYRLEKVMREVLEDCSADPKKLAELITGKRVQLAEDLKRVRSVQEKLEEFVKALKHKDSQ